MRKHDATIFITDLGRPEGPVQLDSGDLYLVEMDDSRGCVSYIDAKTRSIRRLVKTGRPNGLARDALGRIWIAESAIPSLLRMEQDGSVTTVAVSGDGVPFIFPNDLAFGPDGMLYMTDSGILSSDFVQNGAIRSDWATAPYNGKIFQINPANGNVSLIDDGFKFINGLAFSPEGLLYVNETITGNVYRYKTLTHRGREFFGNVIEDDGQIYYRGPDGMKFSESGLLYCAVFGQGDVTVLSHDGSIVKRIQTLGRKPTNVVFGLKGTKTLLVTEYEKGNLESHNVGEDGLPLFMGVF